MKEITKKQIERFPIQNAVVNENENSENTRFIQHT